MNCRDRFVYTMMVTFGISFCIWFTIVTWPANPLGNFWQGQPDLQALGALSLLGRFGGRMGLVLRRAVPGGRVALL